MTGQKEVTPEEWANRYTGSVVWAEKKELGSTPGYAVSFVEGAAEAMWYEKSLFEQWYVRRKKNG